MAAKFVRISNGAEYEIPAAAITGNDPTDTLPKKAGDIVHTRAGQVISARSWGAVNRWTVTLPYLTRAQVASLRTYWEDRVFYLWPLGTDAQQFTVRWSNDFAVPSVGVDNYSLEIELEETI